MRRHVTALCFTTVLAFAAPVFMAEAGAQAKAPKGATAKCGDGTYSRARTQRGACSGHRGVAIWFADASAPAKPLTPPPEEHSAPVTRVPSNAPGNATAQCNDGTYSFAKQHRGACSGHRGVKIWFK